MTRAITGICAAAAFGLAATLGAQTTGTTDTRSHSSMSDRGSHDEITVTGCLQKGADGHYVLTNARMDGSGSTGSTAGTSGSTGATTTGSTGSTATGATTTGEAAGSRSMENAMTWQLAGGKDLDKHVGHRIQVTGRAMGMSSSGEESSMTGSTGGATTGTTAATAGTTGATGTTAGAMTGSTGESPQRMGSTATSGHRLDVKSVKMVSTSCS